MKIIRVNDKGSWPRVALTGVFVSLAGLALLVWPFFTASWLLAFLFGLALIVAGLSVLTHGVAGIGNKLFGYFLLTAGLLSLVFSQATASALVVILGTIFIGLGSLGLLLGLIFGRGSPAVILVPILVIVAGIIPLFAPKFALTMFATFAGAVVLFWGVTLVIHAFKIKNAKQTNIVIDRDQIRFDR